jgi:hypothetical protein
VVCKTEFGAFIAAADDDNNNNNDDNGKCVPGAYVSAIMKAEHEVEVEFHELLTSVLDGSV